MKKITKKHRRTYRRLYKRRTNNHKKSNRKSNTNKKYKIGGTGVFFNRDQDPKTSFEYFINNSVFQLLTRGANGVAILATIKSGIVSPYKSMDSETYGNPINLIVIKLIMINAIPVRLEITRDKTIKSTMLNNIVDELNIQTNVALKTMEYLEPICPSPLYFNENISAELLTVIENNIIDADVSRRGVLIRCIRNMINILSSNIIKSVSAIAMEFAENYSPLYKIEGMLYKYMTAYILIKLAIDTGYSHGDYHTANIMINTTKQNYFNGLKGAPLLIDYGYASKIQPTDMDEIKTWYKNKQYTNILRKLLEIPRKDGLDLRSYPDYYSYLQFSDPNANTNIDTLFRLREESIQLIVQKFERERAANPMYPLLPLSKSFRNQLYSGVDIRNEIVVPVLLFTRSRVKEIISVFDWMYDVLFRIFNASYNQSQLRCFFIMFCYNYVYILNSIEILTEYLQLYSLIALLFIENFNIEDNNSNEPIFLFIRNITANQYSDKDKIILNTDNVYPLFKNKKVNSMYAPIIAQNSFTKKELIGLMLSPQIYSEPETIVTQPKFIGPVQPRPIEEDDAYVFPGEEQLV